ncbi:unnamed protein product [Auanema sp. JU1783]|nr:unnamed protein product [Auanema sp. JU1783]
MYSKPTNFIIKASFLSDPQLRGWTFSSVSIGLLLGTIPLTFMNRLGTKKVLAIYVLTGCFSSFLYPWSHALGFLPSFIIRTIQGMPGAIILWAINNISMEWAPKSELGFAIAVLSSIYQISPILAMVVAGEMCTTFGWEFTYYGLSFATFISLTLFLIVYDDDFRKSRYLDQQEKEYISLGKIVKKETENESIPFSQVFRDPQAWLVWYMYFSFFTGMYIFLQYGPIYINMVLKYDIRSTGYAAALPHLISLALKIFYGNSTDDLCGLGMRVRMFLMFALVELISAFCLLSLIFTTSDFYSLFIYVLFNTANSLAVIVIMKQIQLISSQHSHFLANGNTFIVAICIFCAPFVVNFIVSENTASQWTMLFSGISAQLISSVVAYGLFGKTKPSTWTELSSLSQEMK